MGMGLRPSILLDRDRSGFLGKQNHLPSLKLTNRPPKNGTFQYLGTSKLPENSPPFQVPCIVVRGPGPPTPNTPTLHNSTVHGLAPLLSLHHPSNQGGHGRLLRSFNVTVGFGWDQPSGFSLEDSRLEPTNHPFRKEHDLNQTFMILCKKGWHT